MIETQKKIASVIAFLGEKDKDTLKSLSGENALDMAGFGGEKFQLSNFFFMNKLFISVRIGTWISFR